MNMKNLTFCHWDIVRFLSESFLAGVDGTPEPICVSNGEGKALMIFLGYEDDSKKRYQVKIIKTKGNSSYVPAENDKVDSYEENDEEANFFFSTFDEAIYFTSNIGYMHPEYKVRPFVPCEEVVKKYDSE